MKTGIRVLPALIALGLLAAAPRADATIITLSQDACTGTCGIGPFGTVELIQTTASLVTVTVTLAANERFAGTGAGEALAFNVFGPAITLGSITTGFGVDRRLPAPAPSDRSCNPSVAPRVRADRPVTLPDPSPLR